MYYFLTNRLYTDSLAARSSNIHRESVSTYQVPEACSTLGAEINCALGGAAEVGRNTAQEAIVGPDLAGIPHHDTPERGELLAVGDHARQSRGALVAAASASRAAWNTQENLYIGVLAHGLGPVIPLLL